MVVKKSAWAGTELLKDSSTLRMKCSVCGEQSPNREAWEAHVLKGCSAQRTRPSGEGSVKMETEDIEKNVPNIDELSEIELPEFDLTPYVGRKVKVKGVETKETKFGMAVVFTSEDLTSIKRADGTVVPVNASKLMGLQQDVNGNWGWGPETKLGKFLKAVKAKTPKEVVGKTLMVQLTEPNANGKRFLTLA